VPHPTDGRTTLADITPSGRTVALAATHALNSAVFEVPGLEAPEVDGLVEILGRLRKAAGDFDPDKG
jgi:hypothetical protein